MNNARRHRIAVCIALAEKIKAELEDIRQEEEDAHDSMPENLQYNSDRSDDMQEAISALDCAADALDLSDLESWSAGNVTDRDLVAIART